MTRPVTLLPALSGTILRNARLHNGGLNAFLSRRLLETCCCVLLSFGSAMPCYAQTAAPPATLKHVWVYGYGTKTCADSTAASEDVKIGFCNVISYPTSYMSEDCLFKQYALGYISATNTVKAEYDIKTQIESLSQNTLDAWLRKYCNAHPLSEFHHAVMELVKESVGESTRSVGESNAKK